MAAGSTPRKQAWRVGNGQREADGATQAGIRSFSASSTARPLAFAPSTSGPSTSTGLRERDRRSPSSASNAGAGSAAPLTWRAAKCSTPAGAGCAQSS